MDKTILPNYLIINILKYFNYGDLRNVRLNNKLYKINIEKIKYNQSIWYVSGCSKK